MRITVPEERLGNAAVYKFELGESGPRFLGRFTHPELYRMTSLELFRKGQVVYMALTGYPHTIFIVNADTLELVRQIRFRDGAKVDLSRGPFVCEEWLQWRRGRRGKPFRFLEFRNGEGIVISGEMPEEKDERISEKLDSQEMLAVNTLGQLAKHPRVSALRRFITGWHLSYLTADHTRGIPEAGPQERLS